MLICRCENANRNEIYGGEIVKKERGRGRNNKKKLCGRGE